MTKKKFVAVTAGILLALLLEFIFAAYTISRGEKSDDRSNVTPVEMTDVIPAGDGYVSDSAKTMFFLEDGASWGSLRLTFAEPTPAEMTLELFYSDSTTPERSGIDPFRRTEGYLLAGTETAVIDLPLGNWDSYRLDLDGAYYLQSIEASPRISLSSLTPSMLLRGVSFWRLAVLLFFGTAGGLLTEGLSGRAYGAERKRASSKGASRSAALDALRVIAMIFVVCVHVEEHWKFMYPVGSLKYVMVEALCIGTLSCNLMFVMLSGALLLPWRDESLGTFVRKRVLSVLLPFLVYSLFYIRGMCMTQAAAGTWLTAALRAWVSGDIIKGAHLWLIYIIFGLYILAIPLRYMLKAMSENTQKILAALIFLFMTFRTVCAFIGCPVGISTFFGDWPGIFLMGYFLTRGWMRPHDKFIIGGGIISFALSVWLAAVREDFSDIVMNCSVLMLLITAAIFVSLLRCESWLKPFGSVLAAFSRYSYSVLLIHYFVLYTVIYHGIFTPYMPMAAQVILPFLLCLVLSFIFAAVIDRMAVDVITEFITSLWRPGRNAERQV